MSKKKIKPLKFKFKNASKVEYKIIWKKPGKHWGADGLCDDPTSEGPEIWINPDLKDKRLLEVLIEEMIHSFWFDKPEKEVRKFASILKNLIYQLGWSRKI